MTYSPTLKEPPSTTIPSLVLNTIVAIILEPLTQTLRTWPSLLTQTGISCHVTHS